MPKEILTFYKNGEKLESTSQTNGKTCLIPVSMEQLYLTGKSFSNLIDLIIQFEFQSVTILLAEMLLIYNGRTTEGCLQEAQNWETKNIEAIKKLETTLGKDNINIEHWKESLSSERFTFWKQTLESNTDCDFRAALHKTIGNKLKKHATEIEALIESKNDQAISSSLYLIEEGAVFLDWLENNRANFIVYPKPITPFLAYLSKIYFPDSSCYYLEAKNIPKETPRLSSRSAGLSEHFSNEDPLLEQFVKLIITHSPNSTSAGETIASFYEHIRDHTNSTYKSVPVSLLGPSITKVISNQSSSSQTSEPSITSLKLTS